MQTALVCFLSTHTEKLSLETGFPFLGSLDLAEVVNPVIKAGSLKFF